MRSGNPDCFSTQFEADERQKDTRATLSSNPEANAQVYTSEFIFKVASYALISAIFRTEVTPLDTVKTQEVPHGSRWKTCS